MSSIVEAVTTDQILAISILVIAILFVVISAGFLFFQINGLFNSVKEMKDRANTATDIINTTATDVEKTEQLIQGFNVNSGRTQELAVTGCGFNCALAQVTACIGPFPNPFAIPYSQVALFLSARVMTDRANKSIEIINQTATDVQATEQLIQGFAINSGKTHDALVTACGFNCALAQVTKFFPPSNRVPYSQTCQDLLPNLTCNI